MSTEEKIKEAFERQADRAPDHVRVLTDVMAKTGKRRSRPIVYSLIATGVAAAVAVPIMTLTRETPETLPARPPSATVLTSDAPIPERNDGVMRFRPEYLPENVVETHRTVYQDGRIARTWSNAKQVGVPPMVVLEQDSYTGGPIVGPDVVMVDINGTQGVLKESATPKLLWWSPAKGIKLSLWGTGLPGGADELLRIARSVKRGADVPIRPMIQLAWLPSGLRDDTSTVQIEGNGWQAVSAAVRPAKPDESVLIAAVSPSKPALSGTPTTVRGAQGFFESTGAAGQVWVQLGADRWLQVSGPYDKAALVHVADSLRISNETSFPWLGQR